MKRLLADRLFTYTARRDEMEGKWQFSDTVGGYFWVLQQPPTRHMTT